MSSTENGSRSCRCSAAMGSSALRGRFSSMSIGQMLTLHRHLSIRPCRFVAKANGQRGGKLLCRKENRSEEHTSELQSLMRISYAVFCLKKKKTKLQHEHT